jgi:hypothetical protein
VPRYYLSVVDAADSKKYTKLESTKNTKAEIERWIADNIKGAGLDWRVGFMVKFRNSTEVYAWRNTANDKEVKP